MPIAGTTGEKAASRVHSAAGAVDEWAASPQRQLSEERWHWGDVAEGISSLCASGRSFSDFC